MTAECPAVFKSIVFTLLAVLGCAASLAAAPYPLRVETSSAAWMPSPRSNAAAVEWHDRIYYLGGNNDAGATSTVWMFNPYTREFRSLPPMPHARYGHGAVVVGHQILVYGGICKNQYLNTVDAFDLRTHRWSTCANMPFTRARFGLAVLNGVIYLAGGSNKHGRTAAVFAYDPRHGAWSRQPDLPAARDRLALVACNGHLYAMGGETAAGEGSNETWCLEGARWKKLANLAEARRNFTAVRLGRRILVLGGWNIVDDVKLYVGRVEMYDTKAKDWLRAGDLETACDGLRAVVWRGRVLCLGGFNGDLLTEVQETRWRSMRSRWRPDPALHYQLAWFDPHRDLPASGVRLEVEKPLVDTPEADITNIRLTAIRSLGFPLPEVPDEAAQSFFLKRYEYPSMLSERVSERRATGAFLFGGTASYPLVTSKLGPRDATTVKVGEIAPTARPFGPANPFPPLRVPLERFTPVPVARAGAGTLPARAPVTPQTWFDHHVLFSSIYVMPMGRPGAPLPRHLPFGHGSPPRDPRRPVPSGRSPEAGAPRPSPRGTPPVALKPCIEVTQAFESEIAALLQRSYREVLGPDARYLYFIDDSESDQAGAHPHETVIRILRNPLQFSDYRSFPMPGNRHLFLGSLLLLYRDDYDVRGAGTIQDVSQLKTAPFHRSVFEVGAVLRAR